MIVKSCEELLALAEENLRECPFPGPQPAEDNAWRSTFIPHPQVQNDLEGIRERCTKPLLALDREISDLEKQQTEIVLCLESLKEQRSQQVARIARLSSVAAPHKKLPAEVLSRVFELANKGSTYYISGVRSIDDTRYTGKTRDNFPEHVCSFWRQVALKTAALYRNVWVNYNYLGASREVDELTEVAKRVIARGTRHLTIHLGVLPPSSCRRCFADLVCPFGWGLEQLSAFHDLADEAIMDSYASLLPSLPNLKAFEERFRNEDELAVVEFSYHLIRNVPSNFRAKLTKFHGASLGSHSYITIQTAHYLLSRCPHLEECSLGIANDEENPDSSMRVEHDQIRLSNLAVFHIDVRDAATQNVVSLFLRPFVLPVLERLRISSFHSIVPGDISALIARSNCKLLTFRLEEQMLSEGDLMALLPSLHTVQELSMRSTCLSPTVFQRISNAYYLPNLQGLEVHTLLTQSAIEDIVTLVESRWDNQNGANIAYLQCWYSPSWGEGELFYLQELEDKFNSHNRVVKISMEPEEDEDYQAVIA